MNVVNSDVAVGAAFGDSTPGRRHLTCSVCGSDAGRFVQWHNRDTGWGLCEKCRDWLPTRHDFDRTEFVRCYGIEGIHFEAKPIQVFDRIFVPVAVFDGPNYVRDANDYMRSHEDTGLLADEDGRAYIARLSDFGKPAAVRASDLIGSGEIA